ncbi:MAG TPA: hypothetical protein VFY84_08165 [Jiangellales bacterium]|nr:hypothetical protein [Jiangellales bacterium]
MLADYTEVIPRVYTLGLVVRPPETSDANHRDQYGELELSWATEPARSGWVARRRRVTFTGVVEYRWRYFDVDVDSGEEGAPSQRRRPTVRRARRRG